MQPDILLFMSDQHAPQYMGGGEIPVDTPHLDALRREGVEFSQAYTACPLCVPARMAMLCGMRPSRTGIFTNVDALPDTLPTFLHYLVAEGYETVLVGRMHFVGLDQRHGFTKRIAPDFTNSGWARPPWLVDDFGVHTQTMGYKWCTHVVGGGRSPVQIYDEMVVSAAQDYLSQPHEKPQFILVGTYGPHFPYVAPEELFKKYIARAEPPQTLAGEEKFMNPILRMLQEPSRTPELAAACQAAYRGMVEKLDGQLGEIRKAFQAFTAARGTPGLFGYLSDHGDTIGEHGIFGKKTFFEKSVRIPLIFAGDGVAAGKRWNDPVSLLDLGPTICAWAAADTPERADGISLKEILHTGTGTGGRTVFSEGMDKAPDGHWVHSIMVRQGRYKYISYHGYENQDMLFEPEKDPKEQNNLAAVLPAACAGLRAQVYRWADPAKAERMQKEHAERAACMAAFEKACGYDDRERFRNYPEEAKNDPAICVTRLTSVPGPKQTSEFLGLSAAAK